MFALSEFTIIPVKYESHHSGVTYASWGLKSPGTGLGFFTAYIQAKIVKNVKKLPITGLLMWKALPCHDIVKDIGSSDKQIVC